jgi:hypothetical protein
MLHPVPELNYVFLVYGSLDNAFELIPYTFNHSPEIRLKQLAHLDVYGTIDCTQLISRCSKVNSLGLYNFKLNQDSSVTLTPGDGLQTVLASIMSTLEALVLDCSDQLQLKQILKLSSFSIARFPRQRIIVIHNWMLGSHCSSLAIHDAFFSGSLQQFILVLQ